MIKLLQSGIHNHRLTAGLLSNELCLVIKNTIVIPLKHLPLGWGWAGQVHLVALHLYIKSCSLPSGFWNILIDTRLLWILYSQSSLKNDIFFKKISNLPLNTRKHVFLQCEISLLDLISELLLNLHLNFLSFQEWRFSLDL